MKVGLLLSHSLSPLSIKMLDYFFNQEKHHISVCIIDDRPPKSLYKKIKKNLKRGRGGYILIMFLKSFAKKKTKRINSLYFFQSRNIPVVLTRRPYSSETLNKIKAFKLDLLILVSGFGIIKEPLLRLCKQGIISYHHGNMRKYRGMPPAFWEIYNGEKEIGVTVQRLSKGLDCGEPIMERSYTINYGESLGSVLSKIYLGSVDMMYKAVEILVSKNYIKKEIDIYGKVYTLPNLKQWIFFNIKLIWRKLRISVGLKKY
jgi:folate-dependent phosphoribosylglycinamide formyltransferase PurN